MPKILKATRFGNPILRSKTEIRSGNIQELIKDMRYTLLKKEYGVGIAAPQIGIKPTPNRPNLEPFDTVITNPEIIETYGNKRRLWEGCISCGTGSNTLFAQVLRYKKIRLRWIDEKTVSILVSKSLKLELNC